MIVYDHKGKPVQLGEVAGRGGEATVYRVGGQTGRLAKLYEPAPRPNYPYKLGWMLAHPPANPTRGLNHPSLAWPSGLLYDAHRQLVGYLMPFIQGAVPILDVFNPRRRAEILPRFDRRYLHRAARNLAAALGALHSSGYVAGDLNESNVLVTPSALVTLIDTDSFQVQEQRSGHVVLHFCPVGKLEYTPPELQGVLLAKVERLPEQDAFGLGVLIFQLLMQGSHPFRAQWLAGGDPPPIEARIAQGGFPYTASPACPVLPPKNAPELSSLHPDIAELVRRCFVDGHRQPDLRPEPAAWERAIAKAEKALVRCERAHIYSNHLPACPHCPTPPNARRGGPARPTRRAPAGASSSPPAAARSNPGRPASAQTPPRWGKPWWHGWGARVAGSSTSSRAPAAGAGAAPNSAPAGIGTHSGRPTAGAPAAHPRPAVGTQGRAAGSPGQPAGRQGWAAFRSFSGWFPRPVWQGGPSSPAASAGAGSTPWPSRPGSAPRPSWPPVNAGWGAARPGTFRVPGSAGLWDWARPRLFKSLAVGGGFGALAGILPGAVAGALSGPGGEAAAWGLLWALGGAAGGLLRGWRPGYRLSQGIQATIGWQRFWPLVGMLAGASLGGFLGLVFGWWAILPVFLGLIFGGRLGLAAGRKLWLAGSRLGWERILAASGATAAGLAGWVLARWASASGLGSLADEFAGSLALWLVAHSAGWGLAWAVVGALGGALGGAVAGFSADLIARITGLVD